MSIKNKLLEEKMNYYIMDFDAFRWKFPKRPNKSALLSLLVDYDGYARKTKAGYFKCTAPFIQKRLNISDNSISALLNELAEEGYLDMYVVRQMRFVKLNEERIIEVFNDWRKYYEESMLDPEYDFKNWSAEDRAEFFCNKYYDNHEM